MALISERKKKINSSGSYARVFNNIDLGELITKIHSTSISNGNELEKMILEKSESVINDVNDFERILNREETNWNIVIIPKKIVKKSSVSNLKEPDFIVIQKTNETLNIIELKDGWVFDTKKAIGEYDQLLEFQNDISKIVSFRTKIYMCSFNNNDKNEIFKGFKKKIPLEDIMTGEEFCELLGLDYYSIDLERRNHANKNLQYFIQELLKIDIVRNEIVKQLKEK